MITASESLKNIFKQQKSIKADVGCEIEYNMNSLIDGITVVSATPDSSYTSQIAGWPSGKANPYKKLFPIDSILKPFRPVQSGIKYFVFLPNDTVANSFSSYRALQYPGTQPRLYYPGVTTQYKYWLSAKDANVNITVNYLTTGLLGNKSALSNKIIVRFEKYHTLPTTYSLVITKSDNTTQSVGPFSTPTDGNAELNYNGTSWVQGALSEPVSYATPILIKSINLTAINPGGGKVIGVIEVSARLVKDISSDIVKIDIQKESSSSAEDILPVGFVSANSINLELVKYNQSTMQTVPYNRLSTSFDSSLIYMAKNAEIRPYFKIYHSGATTVAGSYDKVKQGMFYVNDFNISAYGETTVFALDGSKYLMDTLSPDIICENYPVTAILRRLLDSVGFANYNFNLNTISEASIPQIDYWWTDDSKTVWESIQELCRDIQMNAFFDENNVLQFYSRDYIYDNTRTSQWDFYSETEGSTLPNIIDFVQKDIVGANFVKVLWDAAITSNYTGTSGDLWRAPTAFLSAGGLLKTLSQSDDTYLTIDTKSLDVYAQQQSFYNFAGFVLIDSEIIEYDGIEYDLTLLNGTKETQLIKSSSDVNKYRALCKSGYSDEANPADTAYFKPSGRYKIKKRGALGTVAAAHSAQSDNLNNWTSVTVSWNSKQPSTSGTSVPSSGLDLYYTLRPKQISLTSVELDFVAPSINPTHYLVTVQRLNDDGSNAGAAITLPQYTNQIPLIVENLFPGSKYTFRVTPKNGADTFGNSLTSPIFTMSNTSSGGSVSSSFINSATLVPQKSYFKLTNSTSDKDKYVMAYRDFLGITLATATVNGSYAPYSYPTNNYSLSHYSFGTSVFLDADDRSKGSSAGLGFFVNDLGKTGYFVVVETTKSSTLKETKSVRILKADGVGVRVLADSQRTASSTFEGVFGGTQYNIDARVKVDGSSVTISVSINGYRINATDTNSNLNAQETNKILAPTKSVAIVCGNGSVAFDYAYGTNMTETKYQESAVDPNLYLAQYSNDLLDMSFGDIFYDANNSDNTLKSQTVDDFGTVVREIYYVKTKLNARPAFPVRWSTSDNRSVNLIGQKFSNFEAEAYVLNNTSTTIPLSDGGKASLYIFGNEINSSGTLEYSTDDSPEYVNKEPVIFESRWLQNQKDVQNLANFIKTKAINKGKVIDIDIFGNPLLSIGDIVSIKYTYQGLLGTEKMIITNISQSFEEGISTSIKCRTI